MKSFKRIVAHILYHLQPWIIAVILVFVFLLLQAVAECPPCVLS